MAASKPLTFKELSTSRAKLNYNRSFNTSEFEKIQNGFITKGIDDRWYIFYENWQIFFLRSWTSDCIYMIKLTNVGDRIEVEEALVCRDNNIYTFDTEDYDVKELNWLIDKYLLS